MASEGICTGGCLCPSCLPGRSVSVL
jgi:hypothetical protein